MAIDVNLLPLKVPPEVRDKVGFETDRFLNDLLFSLFQLRQVSTSDGGTGPSEPGNTTNNSFSFNGAAEATKVIPTTETTNVTMVDYQFVNAKNSITVTFPQYPVENSFVIVRNGDGSKITLDGNGKNINGSSSGVLRRATTTIEFFYFIDDDEWFAR